MPRVRLVAVFLVALLIVHSAFLYSWIWASSLNPNSRFLVNDIKVGSGGDGGGEYVDDGGDAVDGAEDGEDDGAEDGAEINAENVDNNSPDFKAFKTECAAWPIGAILPDGVHRIPRIDQFAALNLPLSQYFAAHGHGFRADAIPAIAQALRVAMEHDCLDAWCESFRVPASEFLGTTEQVCLLETHRGLSTLLSAVFAPGVLSTLSDENMGVQVLALVRWLLYEVCFWLPRGDAPRHFPVVLSDLLPKVLQPSPGTFGVAMCHTDHNLRGTQAVISAILLYQSNKEFKTPGFKLDIFYVKGGLRPDAMEMLKTKYAALKIRYVSLTDLYGSFATEDLCKPLAALASRFQNVVVVSTDSVFPQPPRNFFAGVSGFQETGAGFFRTHESPFRPGGLDKRDPYSLLELFRTEVPTADRLHQVQDANPVVLDRFRADLGVLGAVGLMAGSLTVSTARDDLWWLGFELMRARYKFSRFFGGMIARKEIGDKELRRMKSGGVVLCGNAAQFDDQGAIILWNNGWNNFKQDCDWRGEQLRGLKQHWPGKEIEQEKESLIVRHEVSAQGLGEVEVFDSPSCGQCTRVIRPWYVSKGPMLSWHGVIQFIKDSIPNHGPLLANPKGSLPVGSPRFPAHHQFRAFNLSGAPPEAFQAAVETDCDKPHVNGCRILKVVPDSFNAPQTVEAIGRTMRGLAGLLITTTQPHMQRRLAEQQAELPGRVVSLAKRLIHDVCEWLPETASLTSEWPSEPWELLPSTLHPTDEGPGLVVCAGSRNLRHLLFVLGTIRNHFKSQMPVEVFYFDDFDLLPAHRQKLKKLFPHIFFRALASVFPTLVARRFIGGWDCKVFAALSTRFRQVALLDADTVLLQPPENFFNLQGFRKHGAHFFRDRPILKTGKFRQTEEGCPRFLLRLADPKPLDQLFDPPKHLEELKHVQDSSLVVLDRRRSTLGLLATASLMGVEQVRSETQAHVLGDKELFWIGFEMMRSPYQFSKWLAGNIGNAFTPPPRANWKEEMAANWAMSASGGSAEGSGAADSVDAGSGAVGESAAGSSAAATSVAPSVSSDASASGATRSGARHLLGAHSGTLRVSGSSGKQFSGKSDKPLWLNGKEVDGKIWIRIDAAKVKRAQVNKLKAGKSSTAVVLKSKGLGWGTYSPPNTKCPVVVRGEITGPRHCGHMLQFDDDGKLLYWNGGVGSCDHRESAFSHDQFLSPTSFLRTPAEEASLCFGTTFRFHEECGWCYTGDMALIEDISAATIDEIHQIVETSRSLFQLQMDDKS